MATPAEQTTTANVIDVANIEVIYNHVILVLKGVSLTVPQGAIVALLGANGAGKSTTLKAISNLLRTERGEVTKGHVLCRGERVDGLTPNDLVRRGVIQVMEGRHCFGHLTVEENLLTGAFIHGSKRRQIADDLEKVYHYFPRLKERRTSQAGYTSGGEQQMVAIGRALMAQPRLLMLDEPSLGIAPKVVAEIADAIQRINRDSGIAIVLVEQNARLALRLAHHAYAFEHGEVVRSGKGSELLADPFVQKAYLGI
jgi:branched-chain amino acid transport system ATP-binding protein